MSVEISHFDIAEKVAAVLLANADVLTVAEKPPTVHVEEDFNANNPDACPWIGVYLRGYEIPALEERIGGTSPAYINIEVWLYQYAMEAKECSRILDTLYRKAKAVLKGNRNLDNTVQNITFDGGEYNRDDAGLFKGVSIKIKVEVRE